MMDLGECGYVGFSFFFFQAEDGIRDFCLSRGLGDVYKRQVPMAQLRVCCRAILKKLALRLF